MTPIRRTPFLGSLSIHVLALLALIAVRDDGAPPAATDTAPRSNVRVVYLHSNGAGGGGGGGGRREAGPVRRAEAPGRDRVDVPVSPPPSLEPTSSPVEPIVDAPTLPAVPMGASPAFTAGVIDPDRPAVGAQGLGRDGAGTGPAEGNGPGDGRGQGAGEDRGTGGRVYEPGGGVTSPVPVRMVRPQYTSAAMAARIGGAVWVRCVVLPDGSVDEVRVVRSLDARLGLDEEAIKAAKQWRFRPGILNGQPVAVAVLLELSFSIY